MIQTETTRQRQRGAGGGGREIDRIFGRVRDSRQTGLISHYIVCRVVLVLLLKFW